MGGRRALIPATPRVLVLGAGGLLGSHLVHVLAPKTPTFAPRPSRGSNSVGGVAWLDPVDATRPLSLGRIFATARPDVVVNCIGCLSRASAADPLEAILVNAVLPWRVGREAAAIGAWSIYISTDAVFSGRRGSYGEDDEPDARDTYGRSKLLGETTLPHCLNVRTSFFGLSSRGTSLMDQLVRHPAGAMSGYTRARFSGLPAPFLALQLASLVVEGQRLAGVYHVGGETVSKFSVLTALARRFRPDIEIVPLPGPSVDRSLDSDRFWRTVGRETPSLAETLRSFDGHPLYESR